MTRFRRRPPTVEAFQFYNSTVTELFAWYHARTLGGPVGQRQRWWVRMTPMENGNLRVATPDYDQRTETVEIAWPGDWIVEDLAGNIVVIDRATFLTKYEPADD